MTDSQNLDAIRDAIDDDVGRIRDRKLARAGHVAEATNSRIVG
jgi:hypothetical protein